MRRRLLVSLAALLAGGAARPGHAADGEARRHLQAVRHWGCQYQNIDLAAVAASDLDCVALEPSLDDAAGRFITPAEIEMLKRKPDGSRRLVLGYLPVGEADIKRWYVTDGMRADPPSWLGPANPDWPGARHVRYWDRDWHEFVATGERSLLRRIIRASFDGALLDRVDAYGDWQGERPSAQDDMIDLVQRIRDVAAQTKPDFLLVPQNAEHLLISPRYLGLIDGLNKESLLTGLRGPGLPNREADVEWSLERLRMAKNDGVTVFATEYVAEPAQRARLAERFRDYDLPVFFAQRELDRLPVDFG